MLCRFLVVLVAAFGSASWGAAAELRAGFGETDVTPSLAGKPVYLAGFGHNRKATRIHDPLMARALVLQHQDTKLAIVSVDVVGLFHDYVLRVRERLPGFTYVLVSSTHNHEGPDTLGLWGPLPLVSGSNPDYMKELEEKIVQAVRAADAALTPVDARIATVHGPELLHDSREHVKHDDLVASFVNGQEKPQGSSCSGTAIPRPWAARTLRSAPFRRYTVRHASGTSVPWSISLAPSESYDSLHVQMKDKMGRAEE